MQMWQTNEFTARAFGGAGGLPMLLALAQQQPSLPPHLLLRLMACMRAAVRHPEFAEQILQPPESYMDEYGGTYSMEISGYQTMLLILGMYARMLICASHSLRIRLHIHCDFDLIFACTCLFLPVYRSRWTELARACCKTVHLCR